MKILIIEPGKAPRRAVIPHTLEAMQHIVGGYIQALYPFEDPELALVCNEEAKLIGLPLNRALFDPESGELYDIVAGTFFLCGAPEDSDSFESLTEDRLITGEKMFGAPEMFLRMNGQIIVFPIPAEE